jgi:hypothetical protein
VIGLTNYVWTHKLSLDAGTGQEPKNGPQSMPSESREGYREGAFALSILPKHIEKNSPTPPLPHPIHFHSIHQKCPLQKMELLNLPSLGQIACQGDFSIPPKTEPNFPPFHFN